MCNCKSGKTVISICSVHNTDATLYLLIMPPVTTQEETTSDEDKENISREDNEDNDDIILDNDTNTDDETLLCLHLHHTTHTLHQCKYRIIMTGFAFLLQ